MTEHDKMETFRAQMADIATLARTLNNIVQMPAHESIPAEDALIMMGLSTLAGMVYEAGFIPAQILMDNPGGMEIRDKMMDVAEKNEDDPRAIYTAMLDILAPSLGVASSESKITDTDLEKLLGDLSRPPRTAS